MLFVLAKSAVLVAPLFAAYKLDRSFYGTIEWWLALSMAIGPMLGVGAHAVVAYGTLGSRASRHICTAAVFVLQIAVLLVALSLLLPVAGFGWRSCFVGPVALQCAVVVLQVTLAARLKALGKGAWASLVESSLYFCLLGAVAAACLGANFLASYAGLLLLACAGLVAGLARFVALPPLASWLRLDYRAFFKEGWPFMMGGALAGWFMAAPRALLGFYVGAEAVARFAIIFRWLSLALAGQRFLNTVFFQRFYGRHAMSERDRWMALVVVLVGMVLTVIAGLLSLVPRAAVALPLPAASDAAIVWLMAVGMLFWSVTACLEGSLFRIDAKMVQIRAVALGLAALLLVAYVEVVLDVEPVLALTLAWVGGFVATIGLQIFGLRCVGEYMSRLPLATLAMLCILLAGFWARFSI